MKSHQKLWSLILLILPVIYIGMTFGFWKGVIAFILYVILSMIFGWLSVVSLSTKSMNIWAYLKGPIIAGIIIFGFQFL